MTVRPLTDAERNLARSMFGEAIDPGRVRIRRATWWPFQPRNALMAPDGDIWCHPRGPHWRDCYASASLAMQALFVHEMTHIWQAQRGGRWYLPLMRHPFCRYVYTLKPGKPFARYGIEQQAEIVQDAFLLRNGMAKIGKPELEVYEALLPFSPFPWQGGGVSATSPS
ncbi:MAG: vgr related protein [Sphingomonadales bacterium]|nr:MAG: vgr related protein [Sphingomonadales bacterium]